ncbi:insulinase family protein [Pseudoramibacter sp.]|jgi:Zn-dependent M16 (insulinase) family peptidase|uniref:insulinase family protein n=1 Tax=Pseudoramibacter sp. TaxID=2034862 RepID=UPI0025D4CDFB|nr:insulinase family protein [Pseudoramibacter sp.]MCH4072943.1 insulinase family protein [Pseudoramibacter sp.]MCH4106714.1 insulinase family protein [Pseudoramibacter sp.]
MKERNDEMIHGFKLCHKEYLEEIHGTAYYFVYEKTQTPLLYLSNDDNNKVFHIAFKTPSNNSTGVAHITEHSVLDGSRKYPVKEPFVELVKGSVNTFLNAMTYPDKTVYPVASTNDKDFMNLIDVYLDAVFYPNIYKNKKIFEQEGWHYQLNNRQDTLTYNGVVYNEMKGVYSSPEEILQNELMKQLYPDTIYGKESGGFPDEIPDLSYEEFLDFHRKFYHPSNAFIYFYGDGDIPKHLAYLDREYLSNFEYKEVDSEIKLQQPFSHPVESKAYYPLSGQKQLDHKNYLTIGWVLNDLKDSWLAFDILANILLGENSYPLKKALLDLNICEDINYSYTTSMQQPYFSITLKNIEAGKQEEVLSTVNKVLKQICRDGIDPKMLKAGINSTVFALKEKDFGTYPSGLMFGLELMDTWLYHQDPLSHLRIDQAIEHVNQLAQHGGFEKMIDRFLIHNSHQAVVTLIPDVDLASKNAKKLSAKLDRFRSGLSDNQIDDIVKETHDLFAYQNREDTPEQLATIPKLELSDLDKKAKPSKSTRGLLDDRFVLWHPSETNGIVYLKFYFDIHAIAQEDLPILGILNKLLFNVRTDMYSVNEMDQAIQIYTGGISTNLEVLDSVQHTGQYRAYLSIGGKALISQLDVLLQLMMQGMTASHFDEQDIIRAILQEHQIKFENQFLTSGNAIASQRLQSYYSQSAALYQQLGGIDFGRFLSMTCRRYDEEFDQLSRQLSKVFNNIFNLQNLTLSISCDPENQNKVYHAVRENLEKFNNTAAKKYAYHFVTEKLNEGIMTSSKINYVAKGYNIQELGYHYNGALFVLKTIMDMGYLWNRVRVKGGAYGTGMSVSKSGDLIFSSYRDPHVLQTVQAYDQAGAYVKEMQMSQRELEKAIIGSISTKDHPLSSAMQSYVEDRQFFTDQTPEWIQEERDQILSTTVKDLRDCGEKIDAAIDQNALCVIGNEEKIRKNQEIFNELTYIQKESN